MLLGDVILFKNLFKKTNNKKTKNKKRKFKAFYYSDWLFV